MRILESARDVRPAIRRGSALVAIALALVAARAAAQQVPDPPHPVPRGPASADSSFRAFLPTFEAATRSFLDGDNAAWKELLSAQPGGTLFTPFGAVVQGLTPLAERYDRAAARLAPGPARLEVEYLRVETNGDLAYVVSLERSTFRFAGSDSTGTGFTRATMIFRREPEGWRLRHRHTDHLGAPPE